MLFTVTQYMTQDEVEGKCVEDYRPRNPQMTKQIKCVWVLGIIQLVFGLGVASKGTWFDSKDTRSVDVSLLSGSKAKFAVDTLCGVLAYDLLQPRRSLSS